MVEYFFACSGKVFEQNVIEVYVFVNSTSTDSELEMWLHSFFMVSTITTS